MRMRALLGAAAFVAGCAAVGPDYQDIPDELLDEPNPPRTEIGRAHV